MMRNSSAAPSAGSRTGTETGHIPEEGDPERIVRRRLGSSVLPKATRDGPDSLEDLTSATPQPPSNMPRVGLTYQVAKLYSGHGGLEDGPQPPEKVRCQSIPRE